MLYNQWVAEFYTGISLPGIQVLRIYLSTSRSFSRTDDTGIPEPNFICVE